ncbi:hypothetical protein AV530_017046 [Patagioenas fasciata monilis]|uniref:Uncharacterized protein n=1 Tax=Patagioenas fasciata monilis TaxID=372326 RepID=A0A1V4J4T4_PATFA|nr:hypothetical protein AV530_017046 [Patagioenas fasciata monilis]
MGSSQPDLAAKWRTEGRDVKNLPKAMKEASGKSRNRSQVSSLRQPNTDPVNAVKDESLKHGCDGCLKQETDILSV